MLINAVIYTEFYKMLSETFARVEYISKGKDPKSRVSRAFWDVEVGIQKIQRIIQIIDGENCGIQSYDYFYRLAGKLNKSFALRSVINDEAFHKALIYIENNKENTDSDPVVKKSFDEQFLHFLTVNSLVDKNKKTELAINTYLETINLNTDENSVERSYIDEEYFNEISQTVEKFYSFLNEKKFEAAWNLLTENFQFRNWPKEHSEGESMNRKGDLNKFIEGYKNTSEILYTNAFRVIKESDRSFKCYVYYDDRLLLYPIKEFADAGLKLVEESTDLGKDIDNFKKKLGVHEDRFNKIPIRMLMQKTLSEQLRSLCGMPQPKIASISLNPHNKTVSRLSVAYVKREGENWLIDFIDDLDVIPLH